MITLHLHDETHISLQSDFRHKDAIKALGPWPDIQWHPELRRWLVDVRLLGALYDALGGQIAPASPEFWMTLPLPKPLPKARARRRTTRQIMQQRREEQAAAAQWGEAIVELMHKEAGK